MSSAARIVRARGGGLPFTLLEVIRTRRRFGSITQWLAGCTQCGEHLMAVSLTVRGGHRKLARRLADHKSHSTCERPII